MGEAPEAVSEAALRPTTEADLPAISDLTESVFGRRRSVELLRWLLLSRNPGPDLQTVVAEEAGRVVGHTAVIQSRYRWHGREWIGAHAILWMLLPEARGITGVKLGRFSGRHGDFTLVVGGTPKSQPILERRRFVRSTRAVELRLPTAVGSPSADEFELLPHSGSAGHAELDAPAMANRVSSDHLRWLAACPDLDSRLFTLCRSGEAIGPLLLFLDRRVDPPGGRIVHLPWLGEGWRYGLLLALDCLRREGCRSASILATDPGLIAAATELGGRPFYERPVWFRAAGDLNEPSAWHLSYIEGDLAYRRV